MKKQWLKLMKIQFCDHSDYCRWKLIYQSLYKIFVKNIGITPDPGLTGQTLEVTAIKNNLKHGQRSI
jgi:hypothetical protein